MRINVYNTTNNNIYGTIRYCIINRWEKRMIGICRFYGRFPFCKQCRNTEQICNHYYENMTDDEREKYERQIEIKKQVKEMLED